MKVPGQEENIDSSQLGMSNVISNDSDSTIVEKSAALAIDRSGSGEPGESSQTLPAQKRKLQNELGQVIQTKSVSHTT